MRNRRRRDACFWSVTRKVLAGLVIMSKIATRAWSPARGGLLWNCSSTPERKGRRVYVMSLSQDRRPANRVIRAHPFPHLEHFPASLPILPSRPRILHLSRAPRVARTAEPDDAFRCAKKLLVTSRLLTDQHLIGRRATWSTMDGRLLGPHTGGRPGALSAPRTGCGRLRAD